MWQYITLMKRIYLIDCPGVVPPSNTDTEEDILLRGVVRVENVENPEQYIEAVLRRVQPRHIERTYEMRPGSYANAIEFLSILARKGGRLLKGGEPDVDGVAKMIINDFLRGKIPWYTAPPKSGDKADGTGSAGGDGADAASSEPVVQGREGRLGEMKKKRREEPIAFVSAEAAAAADADNTINDKGEIEYDDDEFSGFEEDDDNDEDVEVDAEEDSEEEDEDDDDDEEDSEDGGATMPAGTKRKR